jgi:hypothetical protein
MPNEISSSTFTPEKLLVMISMDKIVPPLVFTEDASRENGFEAKTPAAPL